MGERNPILACKFCGREKKASMLLDYRLGGAGWIKNLTSSDRPRLPNPTILLTGQEDYNVDVAASEAGAADYLVNSKLIAMS